MIMGGFGQRKTKPNSSITKGVEQRLEAGCRWTIKRMDDGSSFLVPRHSPSNRQRDVVDSLYPRYFRTN